MRKNNFLQSDNAIIIYQSADGTPSIEVHIENETVWLSIDQMSQLFDKGRSTINEHILNIYKEKELSEKDSMRKIGIPDFSTKPTNYYNLDVIISVGYRVKSIRGTQFRQWATARLREYIVKGFTMNKKNRIDSFSQVIPTKVEIQFSVCLKTIMSTYLPARETAPYTLV